MLTLPLATELSPMEPLCDYPLCEGLVPRPCPEDVGAEEEPSVLSPRSPHPGGLRAGVHVPISSYDEWGVVRDSEQESSGIQAYVLGGRAQEG